MKIVVASTSDLKLDVCRKAFKAYAHAEIVGVKVDSGVAEQPFNSETLRGAFNRVNAAREHIPDASLYVSIENGVFEEAGRYIDRAVIILGMPDGAARVIYSDGVEFPAAAVEEARARGFDTWTVGKVMQEQGLVKQHDDPHQDLGGQSRRAYIEKAMQQVTSRLRLEA